MPPEPNSARASLADAPPSEVSPDEVPTKEPRISTVTDISSKRPRSSKPPDRTSQRVPKERGAEIRAARQHALLCVDNISVSFDGFKALTNLTLILDSGELRCIIGPNGAGKTTLMDVVTGKTKPDTGHVFFLEDMEDLTNLNEHQIARRGIGRKFQRPTVFPKHTVRENLELALAANKGVFRSLFHRFSKEQTERIDHVLGTIGLMDRAPVLAGGLAHGQKQWLEIGMLLAQNPRVLLVDEPIAGMTHQEIEKTAELLRSLKGEHTVVVIEHDMDFVRSIAEKTVTVLHEGQVLAEGSMDEVQSDPKVVEVYLGE
jgi:urea transport system ATP-binding protein